jgi:hypothetical protein
LPAQIDIPFDWGVFGFSAAVTLLTGLLFGLAPAWSAARTEVSSSLKDGAQTVTRRRKGAGGKMLVGFQIALSTLLVIGAGLFLRTVLGLIKTDVGFKTDHLLLAQIDPPRQRYPEGKDVILHQRLEQALASTPGVQAVTLMSTPYLTDSMSKTVIMTEAESADSTKAHGERDEEVGNRYFETLGIPILAGRGFGPQDTATSVRVAVINQSLARTRFSHGDPIGQRFQMEGDKGDWIQVVGICADTRYQNLREDMPPQYFLPYVQQTEVGGMSYVIRTGMRPEAIVPALRRAMAQIDPGLPLQDVRTEQEQIGESMRTERALATLIVGFGLLALALAVVGIYGIMAYSVANRRNEIGIRLALGAQPGQIRGMILILTLALGIGANAVVFSVLNALVLRPVNVPNAQNLYMVQRFQYPSQSYLDYVDLRDRNRTFESMVTFNIMGPVGVDTGGNASTAWPYLASGNYFDALGIQPYLGRFFHAADEHGKNSAPYVVLSYAYWHGHFHDDAGVVGRTVGINKHQFTIIGVAPPAFRGTELFFAPAMWIPWSSSPRSKATTNCSIAAITPLTWWDG